MKKGGGTKMREEAESGRKGQLPGDGGRSTERREKVKEEKKMRRRRSSVELVVKSQWSRCHCHHSHCASPGSFRIRGRSVGAEVGHVLLRDFWFHFL